MPIGLELLKEHRYEELWRRYCGYIDLSIRDFMGIQRHLLQEQLSLLNECELGQRVMRGARPQTVEEFRAQVPLTTYDDYAPYLLERREDVLPSKPFVWQRTSGASSEFTHKWAPISERAYRAMGPVIFAILMFATCRRKGDINFGGHEKILYALAPPPYATGSWGRLVTEELPLDFLPSAEEAETMSFEERIGRGVEMALSDGLDVVFGLPSVLMAIGQKMGNRSSNGHDISRWLGQPRTLLRMAKALAKSKIARRNLMPKDFWSLQGIAIAGSDCALYRERIKEMWGSDPLEVYGCTEGLVIATQTWDRQGMTFNPNLNFLEFIPEQEHYRAGAIPGYRPSTLLLDEISPGENYELVITSLLGGCFVRYRLGDLVKVTALRNEALDIDLPQISFYARDDSLIDLAGFTRLTEKTISQALAAAGVSCQDWVARREGGDTGVLNIYLELSNGRRWTAPDLTAAIHRELKRLDAPYADLEGMLGLEPLRVSVLRKGAFQEHWDRRRASGIDKAQLRPSHINPSDDLIAALLDGASVPAQSR
ncbi:MAG: GH3 auxin-responsive promoter family protein [Chloroflexi bacterium]|nr:GH3 auxin-responsive promoter family protein [Chloroflexota bacterium]